MGANWMMVTTLQDWGVLKLCPNGDIRIGNRKKRQRARLHFNNGIGRLTKTRGHGKILKYQSPNEVYFFRFERRSRFPLVRGVWWSLTWERNEPFTDEHLDAFLNHCQVDDSTLLFGTIGKEATFINVRFGPGSRMILQEAGGNEADGELGIPGVLSAHEAIYLGALARRKEMEADSCRSNLFQWFLSQPAGAAREETLRNLVFDANPTEIHSLLSTLQGKQKRH